MNGSDGPWDDIHHLSYYLEELARIKQDDLRYNLSVIVGHTIVPLDTHDIYAEVNMASISPTITIDIYHIHGVVTWVWNQEKIKEEEVKCELRWRHSDCYWVEVRKREEKKERSPRKLVHWMRRSWMTDKQGIWIEENSDSGKIHH
jgi:hypothetical protein